MKHTDDIIASIGILPVITFTHPDRDAASLSKALTDGGIPIAEVTLRTKGAERAIRIMKESCPSLTVGAGTVLCTEQVDMAIACGAEFIVSPGFDRELVEYCLSKGISVYPGCTSASEYQSAIKLGIETVKFFPAVISGGIEKIKALSAPFPTIKVLPTGGITQNNLAEYISCKAVIGCGASYITKTELINNGKWNEITMLCQSAAKTVREVRKRSL